MVRNVPRILCENNPNFIVPIAFDDVFHEVFGNTKYIDITTLLVSALLNIPFEDIRGKVTIKNYKMSNPKTKSKKGEKDIVVWIDKNEPLKINIELNKYSIPQVVIDRNIFFQSDLFISGLKESNPYSELKTTIQFNLNPEYVDKINKPLIDEYYYQNKYGYILSKKSKIVHINIVEMSDIWYNKTEKEIPKENLLMVLFGTLIVENEKDKFEKLIHSKLMNEKIGSLIERIVLNMNSDVDMVSRYYDREESRKLEWEAETKEIAENAAREAYKEAYKEGVLQNKHDMVVNFYKNGASLDLIVNSIGLSQEEVESIINNFKFNK